MEIVKTYPCPDDCSGTAQYTTVIEEVVYKNTKIKSNHHFYKCDKCQTEFTTTESDNLTVNEVHEIYNNLNK